jgi:hypothetical protein
MANLQTYGYCRRSLVHLDQGPEPRKDRSWVGSSLSFPPTYLIVTPLA